MYISTDGYVDNNSLSLLEIIGLAIFYSSTLFLASVLIWQLTII